MRVASMLLVFGLLLTGATLSAPPAEAVATCTFAHSPPGYPPCADLVCVGYTGGRWVDCYPGYSPPPCGIIC